MRSPELQPNAESLTIEELRVAMETAPNRRSYIRLNVIRSLLMGIPRAVLCRQFCRTDRLMQLWVELFNRDGIEVLITKPKPRRCHNRYCISWIVSMLRPFREYFPICSQITFQPWEFVRRIVNIEPQFERTLHGYTFFCVALYLAIQPYMIPNSASHSWDKNAFAAAFGSQIFFVVILVAFALVACVVERRNKNLKLNTMLNLILPIMMTAIFVETLLDFFVTWQLEHFGLTRTAITDQSNGTEGYYGLISLIPNHQTALRVDTVIQALCYGHFMAIWILCYAIGLDPLRTRRQFESKSLRIVSSIFSYLFMQSLALWDYGIFKWFH